jgi:sugar (pentulose or hexulose) kinase
VPASPSSERAAGPLLLGLDVGTTTCKAAVFDLADPGQPLAVSRTESATVSPRPGWSEADPAEVTRRLFACVRQVLTTIDARRVVAIGISGTACGAWLLDATGEPVRPAILWNDGRAADIVAGWQRDGTLERIFDRSGNVPFPGYTLPVLRWLHQHEPESLRLARAVLCCKDWIRYELTGHVATDETDASYVPFDIRGRRWDAALFEACGVAEHASLFPELLDSRTTLPIRPEVAADLGLPPQVRVALGATDICAALVGAGAVETGHAVTVLGTSANSSIITAEPEFEPRLVGIMAAAPLGRYARTMINTSGSSTLDWGARLVAGGDVRRLLELAEASDDTAHAPVLLPFLAHTGVVSPFVDQHARGVLAGLRVDHGPAEVAHAVVEGLALAVADCYDSIPTRVVELTAVGGAARSDRLLQAIADACAARVLRPQGEEFGARGVALLAAWASGLLSDAEFRQTASAIRTERTFEPDPQRVERSRSRYRDLRDQTRPLWRNW